MKKLVSVEKTFRWKNNGSIALSADTLSLSQHSFLMSWRISCTVNSAVDILRSPRACDSRFITIESRPCCSLSGVSRQDLLNTYPHLSSVVFSLFFCQIVPVKNVITNAGLLVCSERIFHRSALLSQKNYLHKLSNVLPYFGRDTTAKYNRKSHVQALNKGGKRIILFFFFLFSSSYIDLTRWDSKKVFLMG